ncbi:hydroxymethylbilane synthase [Candidatus Magnetomoraceae bacterium gMMP-15]
MENIVKIGTRGSALALWQAKWVKSAILKRNSDIKVELVVIKTKGDKILDVPLAKVGGKGLFVKEIEEALLDGRIDLAVHSMKDMPAEIPNGLCIGSIPERENPQDVMLSKNGLNFSQLPKGAAIGTSSLRRASQLLHIKPDINIVSLRGNLNTRIRKLEEGQMDAIILAAAGVHRMGMKEKITEYLSALTMLPAVGQGALSIEIRQNDSKISSIVKAFDHYKTRCTVLSERAFLHRLEGGCQVPIAGHGEIKDNTLTLKGLVAEIDGKKIIKDSISGPVNDYETMGNELAERILSKGGKEILEGLI